MLKQPSIGVPGSMKSGAHKTKSGPQTHSALKTTMSGFKQSGTNPDCDPYEMSQSDDESKVFSSSQILQSLDVDPPSLGDNKLVEVNDQEENTFGNTSFENKTNSFNPSSRIH